MMRNLCAIEVIAIDEYTDTLQKLFKEGIVWNNSGADLKEYYFNNHRTERPLKPFYIMVVNFDTRHPVLIYEDGYNIGFNKIPCKIFQPNEMDAVFFYIHMKMTPNEKTLYL